MRTLSTLSTLTSVLILSATGIASAEQSNVLERNRSARLQSDSTGRIAARPATPPTANTGQTGGGQAVGDFYQSDRDCTNCASIDMPSSDPGWGGSYDFGGFDFGE